MESGTCGDGLEACSEENKLASPVLLQTQPTSEQVQFEGLELDARVDALKAVSERTAQLQTEMEAMVEEAIKKTQRCHGFNQKGFEFNQDRNGKCFDGNQYHPH